MAPKVFIFIGRSGAGKGTQVGLLKDYLTKNLPAEPWLEIETGALFRQFLTGPTYSSALAKEKNLAGERGASFLLVWLWTQFLVERVTGNEHLIFDGVARSLIEAEALDSAFAFYQKSQIYVIYLDIKNETAVERLTARGRYDDRAPEAINKRLDWFERDVLPVVDYYRQNSRYQFLDINGEQPLEQVHADIVARLWSN